MASKDNDSSRKVEETDDSARIAKALPILDEDHRLRCAVVVDLVAVVDTAVVTMFPILPGEKKMDPGVGQHGWLGEKRVLELLLPRTRQPIAVVGWEQGSLQSKEEEENALHFQQKKTQRHGL